MNTYEAKISGIIEAVNAKTGESDDNLTDAVQTLVDGYGGENGFIIQVTFAEDFIGETYTIAGGDNESYTDTVPSSGIAQQEVTTPNCAYSVTCGEVTRGIAVGDKYGTYALYFTDFSAIINIKTDPFATVTVSKGAWSVEGVADSLGHFAVDVAEMGEYSVAGQFDDESNTKHVTVTLSGETFLLRLPIGIVIVPWSSGTDAEIAAMVRALDNDTLTIDDTGWQIGDERSVSLSAMEANGVSESHAAQTATLVLMDSEHYDLVNGGKDHFVVGLKNSLAEKGYMNATDTNIGGWDECARRTWCNEVFRAAIPATLRPCFKKFKAISAYTPTEAKTSVDYFSLFGTKEVWGGTVEHPKENTYTSQIKWYQTDANKYKKAGDSGSNDAWWERSVYVGDNYEFRFVNSRALSSYNNATKLYGLAPFGCI